MDEDVFEGLVPLKTEKPDTTNFQGIPVHSGEHVCIMCKKTYDSIKMAYTVEPKLCVGCYYDL